MISRLSAGPPGRRHSLFQHSDMRLRPSRDELPDVSEVHSQYSFNDIDTRHQQSSQDHKSTSSDDNSTSSNNEDVDDIVTLNVGGRIFQTYRKTLLRFPDSRLGSMAEKPTRTRFDGKREELFFDRNSDMFPCILGMYRDGKLHIPRDACVIGLTKELEFWGLSESFTSECCQRYYEDAIGEMQLTEMMKEEFENIRPRRKVSNPAFIATSRGRFWEFLDNPDSSKYAKVWFLCFYVFLLISVANIFFSTHPGCRVAIDSNFTDDHNNSSGHLTEFLAIQAEENPKIKLLLHTRPHVAIITLELLCAVFFTVEFILRVTYCPHRKLLFRGFLTWCDLMYLLPLWVELITSAVDLEQWHQPSMIPGKLILQILMVMRVLRIFTLAKHYRALRVLLLSLRASLREVLLLFTFVLFAIIIYASLVYCAEIFRADSFESMFTGLWWALITMTTVGYGDKVPTSWAGYFIASLCALTGIIIIGMPVPIITSNFHLYYGFRSAVDDFDDAKHPTPKPKRMKQQIRRGNS
ncbi:potassium voltage-gated channel subfamily C member 3-like [Haliotis rubra]|uniref:potassium voltage-gated channel subfamily C member 3-like n=1 Tax=Haliotis rubra TaxID=36100 RepID=UPI001EE5DF6B|nr:potassium voltage-gated channel subfamily C member 3-like [Haliotis rubra]